MCTVVCGSCTSGLPQSSGDPSRAFLLTRHLVDRTREVLMGAVITGSSQKVSSFRHRWFGLCTRVWRRTWGRPLAEVPVIALLTVPIVYLTSSATTHCQPRELKFSTRHLCVPLWDEEQEPFFGFVIPCLFTLRLLHTLRKGLPRSF